MEIEYKFLSYVCMTIKTVPNVKSDLGQSIEIWRMGFGRCLMKGMEMVSVTWWAFFVFLVGCLEEKGFGG